MQPSFTTARLILAPLTLQDAGFILELTNTKEWLRFIGDRNLRTVADAEKYIQVILDDATKQYWIVKLKDSLTSIGAVTYLERDYLPHADIGFAFLPVCSKQGFAYEAASAVLRHISSATILAITVKDNTNSIRLLEKLGFHYEKEVAHDGEILAQYSCSKP